MALLTALNLGINYNTVLMYYKRFRHYEQEAFRQIFQPIGGPGITIEIDEALFRKRKYNRGRAKCTFWILGMVCRSTGKTILIPVLNRKMKTLKFFIEKCVLPGTIINTDCWAGYNFISSHPNNYTHHKINHSLPGVGRFVDVNNPEIRTQMIESRWHDLRLHLPQYGVDLDNIGLI
eukprot:NODE_1300_length_1398_cov_0.338722.p1 type:complete len:177 gc:universal NODE_1300_length_1398_cov_0.338722:286-816(+)